MTWASPNAPTRQSVSMLGEPTRDLIEYDGLYVVRRDLPN